MSVATVTPIQSAKPQVEEPQQDLSKRTVCLKLNIGRLGDSKRIKQSQIAERGEIIANDAPVQVDADKSLVGVSKKLFRSKEYKAVKSHDSAIRKYVRETCLPFEDGVHLLPFPLIEKADARLRKLFEERKPLVAAFVAAYPELCEQTPEQLRGLHNPNDYLPVEAVSERFYFSWRYVNFGVPGQLKNISAEIFRDEREKAAKMMADASSEITAVMRETLAELVRHLAEQLETNSEGKPKRLTEAAIKNLTEFLNSFDFRNVTDDAELKEQVDTVRSLISGVTREQLKNTDALRQSVQRGIADVSTKLEKLVVDKPRRQLHFDEF